jgi:ribosome-associated protein
MNSERSRPAKEATVDEANAPDRGWRGPSRSQKKRDARAVADIGVLLSKLSRSQLAKIPLEDDLREAILSCQNLKKGAYVRQLRYIAQQLNEIELDPIREALRSG